MAFFVFFKCFFLFPVTEAALADERASGGWGEPGRGFMTTTRAASQ